ncbi:hypothetical protein NX059_009315 [Plenodomus lindquistii]|nr:hypothetical protein NX059_009315 [Plenodomus lindquistii]
MSSTTITPAKYMGVPSLAIRTQALAVFTTLLTASTTPTEAECTICLESLAPATGQTHPQAPAQVASNPAVKPACGHAAHHACLLRWTEQKSNCPYCRQEMFIKKEVVRPLRKFAVPFHNGEFGISEALYAEWLQRCESEVEYGYVREFREFWDEEGLEEYVKVN